MQHNTQLLCNLKQTLTLRASLAAPSSKKDVVNQCLEFGKHYAVLMSACGVLEIKNVKLRSLLSLWRYRIFLTSALIVTGSMANAMP